MRRVMKLVPVLIAGALVAAGCGGDDDETTSAGGGTASCKPAGTSQLKVGLAYDIGGRGDKSFNDSAARGLDKAKCDLGLNQVQELEATAGEADAAKEERLRTLADAGFNPIIGVGFAYAAALGKVAKEFPDVKFGIVDDASEASTGDNISNLIFAEEQGSYLVGAAAALKSPNHHIGFIGGVNVPLIQKFEAGYEAGAKAVDPSIKIDVQYLTQPPDFTGFNAPDKGKIAAQAMFQAGADVVYHAAGGSGSGLFDAAADAQKLAIGVDSDQYLTAPAADQPWILTSMIKHVDVAVFDFISKVNSNQFQAGPTVYDLKVGGVAYSTQNTKIDDIKSKLDDYAQQITSGSVTVPTAPAG